MTPAFGVIFLHSRKQADLRSQKQGSGAFQQKAKDPEGSSIMIQMKGIEGEYAGRILDARKEKGAEKPVIWRTLEDF